ncbi:MFS transporter [Dactylosporangium sp. NPDC000555]|uniref:MFS transporter n=1 Tax=Dactylosporangium sp. NPDC000555 TaxID=3154260 RepID=UPI003316B787
MSNSPTPGVTKPEARRPRLGRAGALTLMVLVGCELMLMLDSTILNVALPAIREGLGFSASGLAWVPNAFLLAFGGLLLLGGRAGDILGRRRIFVIGIVVFTIASLLGGLAPNAEWLIVMRAVQGVGAALAGPGTLALIITNFQGTAQTRALGIYSSVTAAAMTLGLVLGGLITTTLSWRWTLLVNVPIGLLMVLLAPRYVTETPRNPGRFDLIGALTSALGATGIVFGLARAADHGWTDPFTLLPLIAGAVALIAFVVLERRAAHPIVPLGLFADRSRAGAYLGILLVPMVTLSMQFLLVQFMQEVLGFSPLLAGPAFLPMAGGMLITAQNAARPLGRYGARVTAATGISLILAGALWLTQISAATGFWTGIFGPLLLAGAGLGLVVVPFNVTIMSTVDPKISGAASGVLQAAMMIGASLGIAILATVSSINTAAGTPVGTPVGNEAIAEGMRAGFWTSSAFAALALAVTLILLRPLRDSPPPRASDLGRRIEATNRT